jgi:hypothetical protein
LDAAGNVAAQIPVSKSADGRGELRIEHQPSLWFLLQR